MQEINRQVRAERNVTAANGLLKEPAHLLAELMEHNPRAAVDSALSDEARPDLASRAPSAAEPLEECGEPIGPMVTSAADEFAHHRSWTTRVMRVQGHSVSRYWDSQLPSACSPSATVRGIRLGAQIAAISGVVDHDANSPRTTTGAQRTVALLLSYSSTPLTSGCTRQYVHDTFFGPAPSASDPRRETSSETPCQLSEAFGLRVCRKIPTPASSLTPRGSVTLPGREAHGSPRCRRPATKFDESRRPRWGRSPDLRIRARLST